MLTKRELNTFLHLGYIPDASPIFPWSHNLVLSKDRMEKSSETQLVREGTNILKEIYKKLLNDKKGIQTVPLSGGLDSRAILGGLLDNLQTSEIQTISYGIPGTFDFDIGSQIANQMHVNHTKVNLLQWKWNPLDIQSCAQLYKKPIAIFDKYINHKAFSIINTNSSTYWSGFMGDPLAGSHIPSKYSISWDEALQSFIQRNKFATNISLPSHDFRLIKSLPTDSLTPNETLSYDEQLDFTIRQQSYIRKIVLNSDLNHETPFLHPLWVNFMLSLPRRYRVNQKIYKKILLNAYPKLFSLPTKTNLGLPLENNAVLRSKMIKLKKLVRHVLIKAKFNPAPLPTINYIDFEQEIRINNDLKRLIQTNLEDLQARKAVTWLNIDQLWNDHLSRKIDHTKTLLLLVSLEIHYKSLNNQ